MKISSDYSLGPYFTFDPSKGKPIFNWFFYKEAYSPEIVHHFLRRFSPQNVLDQFSGIGTTALAAKSRGIQAFGIDSSPLAVFVGQVKTRNYSEDDLQGAREFLKNLFQEKSAPRVRWPFELFPVEKAFPPVNLRDILFIRERLDSIENENARGLLLLALVSILPMCSFVLKDGGVLKIAKKQVAPAKEMFKRRAKKMLADLENPINGPEPQILLGDARELPFENETMDAAITSPPYLNNIDYTKVYGLELSLLGLRADDAKKARERAVRSFVNIVTRADSFPEELGEIGDRIPVAATYFSDMEKVLEETRRVLKPGSSASFIVSNAVIRETHIPVDEILAQIGERLGFECEIIAGLERIADVKPAKVRTRESAIVFRKQ